MGTRLRAGIESFEDAINSTCCLGFLQLLLPRQLIIPIILSIVDMAGCLVALILFTERNNLIAKYIFAMVAVRVFELSTQIYYSKIPLIWSGLQLMINIVIFAFTLFFATKVEKRVQPVYIATAFMLVGLFIFEMLILIVDMLERRSLELEEIEHVRDITEAHRSRSFWSKKETIIWNRTDFLVLEEPDSDQFLLGVPADSEAIVWFDDGRRCRDREDEAWSAAESSESLGSAGFREDTVQESERNGSERQSSSTSEYYEIVITNN